MSDDALHLNDLRLDCRIGVTASERRQPLKIMASVTLFCNLARAGKSDDLADTVDYAALSRRIRASARSRPWSLLEALARSIADVCLTEPRVEAVCVRVEKRRPCRYLGAAVVEIVRRRRK